MHQPSHCAFCQKPNSHDLKSYARAVTCEHCGGIYLLIPPTPPVPQPRKLRAYYTRINGSKTTVTLT